MSHTSIPIDRNIYTYRPKPIYLSLGTYIPFAGEDGGLEGVGAVLLGGEHTAGGGYVLATGGSHGCGDA